MRPEPQGHDIGPEPVGIEAKFQRLEGRHNLLEHSTSSSLQHVVSAIAAMQGDVREQSRSMHAMQLELHGMRAHSEGLDRLATTMDRAVERWDKEFRDHVAENKVTSDAVTGYRGALRVMGFVLTIIFGMAVAILDYRFASVQDTFAEVKAHMSRSENRIERLEQRP